MLRRSLGTIILILAGCGGTTSPRISSELTEEQEGAPDCDNGAPAGAMGRTSQEFPSLEEAIACAEGPDLERLLSIQRTEEERAAAQVCLFELEEALAEVGVAASMRRDCGRYSSFDEFETARVLEEGLGCLQRAPAEQGAEFSINRCTDCSIVHTFVAANDGTLLHVYQEQDFAGDDLREVRVERCEAIEPNQQNTLECVGAELLYSCEEPI